MDESWSLNVEPPTYRKDRRFTGRRYGIGDYLGKGECFGSVNVKGVKAPHRNKGGTMTDETISKYWELLNTIRNAELVEQFYGISVPVIPILDDFLAERGLKGKQDEYSG